MVDLQKLKPRLQRPILAQVLTQYPVVVVHGARQTGKTTLVQGDPIGQGRAFLSLDDFDVRDVAQSDPAALFIGREHITLDEIQRQPELLLAIKADVDRRRQAGRFLLTGSANLLLMERVAETLAGRAVYFSLPPLTKATPRPSSRDLVGLNAFLDTYEAASFGVVACPCLAPKVLSSRVIALPLNQLLLC